MGVNDSSNRTIAFNRVLDWVLGALLGISGILIALGGAALYYGTTRNEIADIIHSGEFQSDVLTEAEAIDAFTALGQWGGIGLAVAGGLIVLLGIAFVIVHTRARRDGRGTPAWIVGVAGATVASVLSFIPFSPVLGGGVAGYLDPDRTSSGLGIGSLAGVFGSLPLLVASIVTSVGLFVSQPPEAAAAVAFLLGFVVFVSLVYFVGLSALGGYLGGWIGNR